MRLVGPDLFHVPADVAIAALDDRAVRESWARVQIRLLVQTALFLDIELATLGHLKVDRYSRPRLPLEERFMCPHTHWLIHRSKD